MSDHSNLNVRRGDGVSGRSILVALVVVLGIIVLLAVAGSLGGASDGTTPSGEVIAPAAEPAPLATE